MLLGVDWCSGVGQSSGDGTWEVAGYVVQGKGYGGGHPASSGCGPDHELTSIGYSDYPAADVGAGAVDPRVRRASAQMEDMGLWRPSLDPIRLEPHI